MSFMQFSDIQSLIADSFFGGSDLVAGMMMFCAVMAIIFVLTKNPFHSLVLALPLALIFSTMGILSTDLTMLLIIVTVLGLAVTAKKYGGEA